MLEIGTMLSGRYEVLKRVGSGGMADVYMAKDHKLNRNVAVKVLKSEYVEDEKFLKKFETEAQAVARLSHPNIVNVYDVGIEDGINYIVMELAEGMTLKEYIRRKGYLSPKETVEISLQIASAISHAHKNHIIHRDIKPQNILVSEIGNVKVTDFGIAKATSSNTVTSTATAMGSVHYISPEQAKGRFCDEKSDIYSLGITMYEMVTGHVPFDHENGVTIALMHLQNEITPPSQVRDGIPDSLEKIILKCTMKKPEDRYQTADELIADLKLVFEDTSGEYVGIVPTIDDSPTIMIDQNELTQRIQTNDDTQPVEDSDSNAYLEEDDEEEELSEEEQLEKFIETIQPERDPNKIISRKKQLTDEEKQLFTYFVAVPGMKEQLLDVLCDVQKGAADKTSQTGNVIIMGGRETGKTRLISSLIPAICKELNIEASKVAYIFAEDLNGKSMSDIVSKLAGGFLVIENANQLSQETADELDEVMNGNTKGMIVILEDEKIGMRKLIARYPKFAKKFTSMINIPVFTNDELVNFAKVYTMENGFRIDQMGMLALYNLIGINQKEDQPMCIGTVKTMLDNAMAKAQGGLFKRSKKRVDRDGYTVLLEKDFS